MSASPAAPDSFVSSEVKSFSGSPWGGISCSGWPLVSSSSPESVWASHATASGGIRMDEGATSRFTPRPIPCWASSEATVRPESAAKGEDVPVNSVSRHSRSKTNANRPCCVSKRAGVTLSPTGGASSSKNSSLSAIRSKKARRATSSSGAAVIAEWARSIAVSVISRALEHALAALARHQSQTRGFSSTTRCCAMTDAAAAEDRARSLATVQRFLSHHREQVRIRRSAMSV